MNTQEKDIDDLLSDPSFGTWVLSPTAELNSFWENWLLQHPEKKETVKKARIVAKALQFDEKALADEDKLKLWRRIKATNDLQNRSAGETKIRPINDRVRHFQKVTPRKQTNYLLRYAAVLAGVFVLAVAATYLMNDSGGEVEVRLVKKINEPGQKSTIFLADGTLVNLNASSTLTYPKNFVGEERKVFLQGEAFFKVKKGVKPFVVETEHLKAQVLGTSFNMKDFAEKDKYSLALLTGKVMVSAADTPQDHIILNPGQKSSLDSLSGRLIITAFDYDEEIAWKEGILVFKEVPFTTVLERLQAWYGVDFILKNAPKDDFLVTGRFDNESLSNVLRSISYTGSFTYSFSGKNVHLNFNPLTKPMR